MFTLLSLPSRNVFNSLQMYYFVLGGNLFPPLICLLKLWNWLYIFIVFPNMQIYLCLFAWSGTDKKGLIFLFVLEDFKLHFICWRAREKKVDLSHYLVFLESFKSSHKCFLLRSQKYANKKREGLTELWMAAFNDNDSNHFSFYVLLLAWPLPPLHLWRLSSCPLAPLRSRSWTRSWTWVMSRLAADLKTTSNTHLAEARWAFRVAARSVRDDI